MKIAFILLMLIASSIFLPITYFKVDAIKHDCIGGGNNFLLSVLSSDSSLVNNTIFNNVNATIMNLVAACTMTLNITNDISSNPVTITGNPEKIKTEISKAISKESPLNDIQEKALYNLIDNAIIIEEATIDPNAPKPNLTLKFSSSNQTFNLKW